MSKEQKKIAVSYFAQGALLRLRTASGTSLRAFLIFIKFFVRHAVSNN
jgi:hypothetical protein